MTLKRGILLIVSLYSMSFHGMTAFSQLIIGERLVLNVPVWVEPMVLIVFVASWAKLWEDIGATDERTRQKEPSHDNQ